MSPAHKTSLHCGPLQQQFSAFLRQVGVSLDKLISHNIEFSYDAESISLRFARLALRDLVFVLRCCLLFVDLQQLTIMLFVKLINAVFIAFA